ncbi:MAG: dihydropteridine reductase [Candidatus Enteromonas sp.]
MDTDKIYAEHLANEYSVKEDSKVIALKKLDAKAKRPAKIFGHAFGVASILIAGTGMCLSMKVIGDGSAWMVALGIVIGLLGFAGAAINYPVYKKILEKGKGKYAFEIIELAKEISGEAEDKTDAK